MKIIIGYPPLISNKGTPLLAQNRQFQWFKIPTYIYPIVPAYAATLLKKTNHEVVWLDGIAEQWSYQQWLKKVKAEKPDLILIETKTPVIKQHWKIINQLKKLTINHQSLIIVLVGDHVTALPEESFKNSLVDYVLTGGNYDFLLLNLVNHLIKGDKLEPGIYYRKSLNTKFQILNTGTFKLNHDLNKLPLIDREITKWQLYAFKNGNYKKTPGTYIMAGRDCWHRLNGGCSFCSWTTLYPQYRVRSVNNVLKEVKFLINDLKIKEIMDDTGTFPVGRWLSEFCIGMINQKLNKKINFNCNMRFGVLTKNDYTLMAKAGFRFLLFGLESANQKTLDRLGKNIKVNLVEKELKIIKEVNKETKAHLEPHITCMVGYPWETELEAEKTLNLVSSFFKKGLIDSLQATIIIPYPGTRLFNLAKKNKWLTTKDWNRYDMKEPVLITKMPNSQVIKLTKNMYSSFLTPNFMIKKLLSIRSLDDLKFFIATAGRKVIGHWLDFS